MKRIRLRLSVLFALMAIVAAAWPNIAFADSLQSEAENPLLNSSASELVTGQLQASTVEEPLSAASDFTTVDTGSGLEITGYSGAGGAVNIPSSIGGKAVVSIGTQAFLRNTSITSISIPSSVRTIGEAAFYGNTAITSLSIPSSVKTIGNAAFAQCTSVSNIKLSEGVTTIGDYAFEATGITSISIPASVTALGSSSESTALVFFGCTSLARVSIASGNSVYRQYDGMIFSKDGSTLFYCPHALAKSQVSIPSTVKKIASSAFQMNKFVKQVDIPSSVTTLGDWCFCQSALTSAVVPATVKFLGSGVFDTCQSLTSLTYKTTAQQPYRLCEGCYNLTKVSLPNGLKKIGFRAFKDCTSLKSIIIPTTVDTIESTAFYGCTGITTVLLPASVKDIEASAFCYCSNLVTVTGGSGVKRINAYAFAFTKISSFPWSSKLEYVSKEAFFSCDNFTNVNIPSYLKKSDSGDYCNYDNYVIAGIEDYAKANEVLRLVNQNRAQQGLAALKMDPELQAAAMLRAAETSLFFSHTRPNGETCFYASAKMFGENIAAGSSTAAGAMDQWMNSAGHRANILSSSFRSRSASDVFKSVR